jgi:hypothetical protein
MDATVLKQLVSAARRHGAQAINEYHEIVQRSAGLLSTLGEPLDLLDFTEHRWVAGQREEAYSDWLQWVASQCEPTELLHIFGVKIPEVISACVGCVPKIAREQVVPHGHAGAGGRLDLEIRFGDAVLLVVEIKLGEAESADTAKNIGYFRSVEARQLGLRFGAQYIILVLDAEEDSYHGFKPRLWGDACIELRLVAARLCRRSEHLRAALILGYVAAVEQNLLQFRPVIQGPDVTVAASFALPPITGHLARFVEAVHAEQNRD